MKTILITGASTGIGRAAALEFANRGYEVFATVRRKLDGDSLTQELSRRSSVSGKLHSVMMDVTSSSSIESGVREVEQKLGSRGLNGLINNAGVVVAGPLESLSRADWQKQFEINVFGAIEVTQKTLTLLRREKGRIINVSSVSGFVSLPFFGPYCASKFAMEAMSDALRLELRPQGMHVVLIEPGPIQTPIWGKSTTEASVMFAQLPQKDRALYGARLDKLMRISEISSKKAIPVSHVTKALVGAMESRRPRIRQVITGSDGWIQVVVNWLPTRLRDAILAQAL